MIVQGLLLRSETPARLAEFYEAVLGVTFEPAEEGGFLTETGGLRIAIMAARGLGRHRPRVAIVLRVTGLDAALALIESRWGLLIRDRYTTDEGEFAFLFDPDGNELGLVEPPV